MPLPEDWKVFEQARDGFAKLLQSPETQSLDRLRYLMMFALCEAGIPLRNLLRRYKYYKYGSFIAARGQLWFLALIRQVDAGLGLVPVLISKCESRMLLLTRKLSGKTGIDGNQLIGSDFLPTRAGFVNVVKLLLQSANAESADWDCMRIFHMIDRCSTFTALVHLGGFLTFSLRDKLILPANYYDIRDLLATMGTDPKELKGLDGAPWRNPYVPSTEALDRAVSQEELFALMGLNGGCARRGRPRKLPARCAGRDVRLLENFELARLVAWYIPCPTFALLYQLGLHLHPDSETAAARRAQKIVLALNDKGLGHVGKPIRLVPPQKFLHFLEQASKDGLAMGTRRPQQKIKQLLMSVAFTGMRLGEAMRLRRKDVFGVGRFETIFVNGTKVDRAKRSVPIQAMRRGPNGEELYKVWRSALSSSTVADAKEPLFASKEDDTKRFSDLLKSPLLRAFSSLSIAVEGEDSRTAGTFTAYSLRHAAALRLIQGAIDSDFVNGNFTCALAEVAQCLGHSLPTLLSSYLGTACLALRWP